EFIELITNGLGEFDVKVFNYRLKSLSGQARFEQADANRRAIDIGKRHDGENHIHNASPLLRFGSRWIPAAACLTKMAGGHAKLLLLAVDDWRLWVNRRDCQSRHCHPIRLRQSIAECSQPSRWV